MTRPGIEPKSTGPFGAHSTHLIVQKRESDRVISSYTKLIHDKSVRIDVFFLVRECTFYSLNKKKKQN